GAARERTGGGAQGGLPARSPVPAAHGRRRGCRGSAAGGGRAGHADRGRGWRRGETESGRVAAPHSRRRRRAARGATRHGDGTGASGEDLVVTVPVDNGKWWVVFRQPKATAYAAARTTAASIVIWTVVLFGATLALLFAFWRRLNQRVTEPVKAAGAIASRVAGG